MFGRKSHSTSSSISLAIKTTGLLSLAVFTSVPALAQDFYAGKTLRLIVGFAPGAAYDRVTRIVGEHIGKHIPGAPTVIVQNMLGAGGLVAVNYMFNAAPADGTVIANINTLAVTQEAAGMAGVKFRSDQFNWLGAITKTRVACVVRVGAGLRSASELMRGNQQILVGVQGPGTEVTMVPIALRDFGASFKVVSGYVGATNIKLAMDQGEVDAYCAGWESLRVTLQDPLARGEFKVFLQSGGTKDPDLLDVDVIEDYIDTQKKKALWAALTRSQAISRAFVAPPGTPTDRVATLRKAFADTGKDADFVAMMAKVGETLRPSTASETAAVVKELLAIPPELRRDLHRILTSSE